MITTNNDTYAIWVPSNTGRQLRAFNTYDLAALFNIKFGGGLEIIIYNIKH